MAENDTLKRVREYVVGMPSLPTTVTKVLEVCNNPRTSPVDLDAVIKLDPVLMGRVMKLINSAYYGISNQVTSLVRAIIMLGVNTVKNLALSTAVLDRMAVGKGFRAINMDGFWRHSLCVGVTAKLIAQRRGVESRNLEEYFAAGLLHDIGKIPMNDALGEDYVRAMAYADRERLPLFQAERSFLGTDHCAVGDIVVENWKLTGAIAAAVAYHHDIPSYSGEFGDVLKTIAVANFYANRGEIGFSGTLFPDKQPPEIYGALGIDKASLEALDEPVAAAIEKAKIFLKLGG
jgi:HD-like signal output (HDOD) protein